VARRRSFASSIAQYQREVARAQAAQARAHAAAEREVHRAEAARLRAAAAYDRDQKRLYIESRTAEVAAMNDDLEAQMAALEAILAATLDVDDKIDFASLKITPTLPAWQHRQLEVPEAQPTLEQFLPAAPTGLSKLFGKSKHEQAVAAAQETYAHAIDAHRQREELRLNTLAQAQAEHQAAVDAAQAEAAKQHAEVAEFEQEFIAGDPDAIIAYFTLVLEASAYPDGFPRKFKLAYVPDSRQLVCEYDLPTFGVVPPTKTYKYIKTSDTVTETPRPATQSKQTYASVVAQVTLRTVHELFEGDDGRHVDTVVFNGMVDAVDPGSGKQVRPCLITLRTTRDTFLELDLRRVDPLACLQHLSAGVSKNPAELVPVRPVLEFNMVDPRFIAESDALSTLDTRPNLMEMKPTDFESLIQNLFTRMGLEAKQTRPSRDGGVDCVAYDPRPIFGGKVVIQAKRYRNTVGVSAVRDLFGTLTNEGASKGILVSTSGYGQASFDFAQNKPIELINGAQLLYLLAEHAGVEAKIVPPDDWVDPSADTPEPARTPVSNAT
jgi:restriction system protein